MNSYKSNRFINVLSSSKSTEKYILPEPDYEMAENEEFLGSVVSINTEQSEPTSTKPCGEKEKYEKSKLYCKYLIAIQTKLDHSGTKIDTEYLNTFNINYSNAMSCYEEIKKEWFWLSNNKICQFRSNTDSINQLKINIESNYNVLKYIAKFYGFDTWYSNLRLKKKNQPSSSIVDIPAHSEQLCDYDDINNTDKPNPVKSIQQVRTN